MKKDARLLGTINDVEIQKGKGKGLGNCDSEKQEVGNANIVSRLFNFVP